MIEIFQKAGIGAIIVYVIIVCILLLVAIGYHCRARLTGEKANLSLMCLCLTPLFPWLSINSMILNAH